MSVEKTLDHSSMGEVVVNCPELLDHVLQVPKSLTGIHQLSENQGFPLKDVSVKSQNESASIKFIQIPY